MTNYFNTNLKYLRITSGLKQEDLGKKLGKDYSTIGKWENGTRSPVMEDVLKIAEIFNVELNKLLLTDLRMQNPPTEKEDDFTTLQNVLKEKGILNENDKISEEDYNKIMDFVDKNINFIINKEKK